MRKKTSEMTIAELRARAAEIRTEVNTEGADLNALDAEAERSASALPSMRPNSAALVLPPRLRAVPVRPWTTPPSTPTPRPAPSSSKKRARAASRWPRPAAF